MIRTIKFKKVLLFLILFSFAVFGAACSTDNHENGKAILDKKDTINVTDCLGRQVEVPADPQRIACLYAFTGHVVTMLDHGQDVVAINKGLSRDVLLNMICPSIGKNLIPFTHDALNIEELLRTEPDVVFVQGSTARNEAEVDKLNKFDLPYVAVEFNTIEEQKYAIELIAQVLGEEEKAREYNEYYQDCIDRVQAKVKEIPENEKLRVYHSVNEATRTDARNSLAADWTEKCGIINVSVGKELKLVEGKNFASLEQILLWDPDLIIVNEAGVAEYMYSNEQWAPLKAVKEKKVYQMPIGIARWGHPGGMETPLGILWTAKTVYPERFEDLDIRAEAREYYKKFFNYSVSDELLNKILEGKDMRRLKGVD